MVYLKVKWYKFKESLWILFNAPLSFSLFSIPFFLFYFFINPYRVCGKFRSIYGETPLFTYAKIAKICSLSSDDLFLDLGSGRGFGSFFINYLTGAKVVGIEKIALFTKRAQLLSKLFNLPNVQFQNLSILDADFSKSTCIYFYSTTFSPSFMKAVAKKIPPNTRVITVSSPISKEFKILKSFALSFPWGITKAYLQIKVF